MSRHLPLNLEESLPPQELETAKETAKEIGIKHLVVQTDELQNPEYTSNRADRCYHCKDTLYSELRTLADSLGLEAILDGTQVDDLSDDRPGFRAAQEAGVKSPLLIASFSKADVRETARVLGLSVWDKPAMPCLSSRINHGEEVTTDKLGMIGQAELYIKELTGVRNLRVRYSNSTARIEVAPDERKLFFDEAVMDQIDRALKQLGFMTVTLDLKGYTRKERTPAADPLLLPMAKEASTRRPRTLVEFPVQSSPEVDVGGRTPMAEPSFRLAFRDDLHSKHPAALLLYIIPIPLPR